MNDGMHDLERELRQHAAALRGLARDLVGAGDADDVVQETALQALRRKPREPGPLVGWLLGIVRHVASRHRRSQVRRSRREQVVARDDVLPPDGSVDASDSLRFLTDAVLALPQPYRGAVFARYLRDLSPGEIAAETGEPVATVKTRLKRGLAMLRERLEDDARRRGGDWRAGLVGVFGLERATLGTTALAAGGMLMTTTMKWMGGGIVAAAAVAAFVWFGELPALPSPPPVAGGGSASEVAVGSLSKDVGNEADGVQAPDRTLAAGGTVAELARARIHGRLVDEHGAPLLGLEVELRGSRIEGGMGKDFEREYGEWLLARGGRRFANERVTTANDGRFQFLVEPTPLSLSLWVQRGGLEHATGLGQVTAKDLDLGDLVVPIACTLRCRVVDEQGSLVATPNLSIDFDAVSVPRETSSPVLSHRYPDEAVGADGIVTRTVVAGPHRCSVRGRRIVRGEMFEVSKGTVTHAHEIVVANAAFAETIAGRIVDERGQALAGVEVMGWNKKASKATSDALGRFTLQRDEQPDGDVRMSFDKDGYEGAATPRTLAWGARDVRFVLRDLVAIEVRVVDDERGEPVTDFGVRLSRAPDQVEPIPQHVGKVWASGEHQHGVARVTDVPAGRHLLVVEPHRWDLWRSGFVPVEASREHVAHVEVRLPRAADRALLVRRSDGTPVRRAKVELIAADAAAPMSVTVGTKAVAIDRWDPPYPKGVCLLLQDTSTNARGEADLHGPAGKDVVVRISGDGFAPSDGFAPFLVGPLRLDVREPVVATVPIGGTLVARVGPAAFVQHLRAIRERLQQGARSRPGFRLQRGRGDTMETVPADALQATAIDADGRFAIAGVPAGDWQLALEPWEDMGGEIVVWAGQGVPVAMVSLREGETTETAVDLAAWLPATITGVVRCNGAPVANERIGVEVARPHPEHVRGVRTMTYAETDAEGRFRYRGRPGDVRVLLNRADLRRRDQGNNWIPSQTVATLPANGAVEQTFDVVVARVRLRLARADDLPVEHAEVVLFADFRHHRLPPSDAEGRVVGEVAPGSYDVQWGAGRGELARITVAAGGTEEFVVRVPATTQAR